MSFGSTSGRGFEVAIAPYAWGGAILLAALLWVWCEYDLKRRRKRDEDTPPDPDRDET